MDYELTDAEKQEIVAAEIESAKREIFDHRINIAKWSSFEGDYSAQIAMAEGAIANLTSAIDALSSLE